MKYSVLDNISLVKPEPIFTGWSLIPLYYLILLLYLYWIHHQRIRWLWSRKKPSSTRNETRIVLFIAGIIFVDKWIFMLREQNYCINNHPGHTLKVVNTRPLSRWERGPQRIFHEKMLRRKWFPPQGEQAVAKIFLAKAQRRKLSPIRRILRTKTVVKHNYSALWKTSCHSVVKCKATESRWENEGLREYFTKRC